jgi:hypothetical protein
MNILWKRLAIVASLLMITNQGWSEEYEFETSGKVFAIGDINGGFEELVAVLNEVELIDASQNWGGGDSHLVSLGNLRGKAGNGNKVIALFMKLEQQAVEAGGRLHVLLGDADLETLIENTNLDSESRDWLHQLPIVIEINETIYVHGGIADGFVNESLESINKMAAQALSAARFSAVREPNDGSDGQQSVLSVKGPARYRGTAMCHPYAESFNTERFLKKTGARQFVIGHVPTDGLVKSRMNGSVILLDTGMSEGGQAAVLVQVGSEDPYVHYLGSKQKAFIVPEERQLSHWLSGMEDDEIENLLRKSPVVKVKEIGTGITNPWRVMQLHDGLEKSAVFKYVDTNPGIESKKYYNKKRNDISDRFGFEVAAYKLDRMLDLQLVPVAVVSNVKGKEGVLQAWITNAINERDRIEDNIPFDGPCDQQEQYRLRIVFDILIHNDDRNLTNILWTKENFMMMFIDHTRAFRSMKKRPHQYRKVNIRVSDLLKERLESLDTDSLMVELSDYLHPGQIESLLARRDLILKEMKSTGS